MKLRFVDSVRLKREAKRSVESGEVRIKRWWVDKYNLPPNHELFQNQSLAELTQEMYEDLYYKWEGLRDMLDGDEKGLDRSKLLDQYNALSKALGEDTEVADPLVAQWEKDLEEGRIPDLDAEL